MRSLKSCFLNGLHDWRPAGSYVPIERYARQPSTQIIFQDMKKTEDIGICFNFFQKILNHQNLNWIDSTRFCVMNESTLIDLVIGR